MKSIKTLALIAGIALTLPVMAQNSAQGGIDADMMRSEEHTSELQSPD